MNETIKTIIERRGCKTFKPEQIKEEELQAIIEAGTYAANGRGLQSPIIISVTNKDMIEKLRQLNLNVMGNPPIDPFYGAPQLLVVLADKNVPTHVCDGSLVIGNMMLAATSLGIGSRWIHRAKETFETEEGKEILKSLGIEGEYEGIGNCILGYPSEELPAAAPRKENYVYYIK